MLCVSLSLAPRIDPAPRSTFNKKQARKTAVQANLAGLRQSDTRLPRFSANRSLYRPNLEHHFVRLTEDGERGFFVGLHIRQHPEEIVYCGNWMTAIADNHISLSHPGATGGTVRVNGNH
jgi:hypothetical protein